LTLSDLAGSSSGKTSVLDPGSCAFLTRDLGWIKNHDPDPRPESYFRELKTIFWVKLRKFFDADQGSEMEKFGSGMEKLRSGIKKIPDP
jgi:hypothetical protein